MDRTLRCLLRQLTLATMLAQLFGNTGCATAGSTTTAAPTVAVYTPPRLTCPANIVVQTNSSGTKVTWPSVTATDSLGRSVRVNQTSGDPSGTVFNVGSHYITFLATDEWGNRAFCSFRVTVSQISQIAGFQITCVSQVQASGAPGSTVSVTIPQPTVSGTNQAVQYSYSLLQSGQTILNPYSVVVPASGSTTVTIRVQAFTTVGGIRASDECQIPIIILTADPCSSYPCNNGGICAHRTDGTSGGGTTYTCTCAPGFSGSNCQTNVDECASAPCLNGGFCVDSINAYTCTCTSGTTGANCQYVIDPCLPNPCWRGGTCSNNHETGFFCSCASGYIGDTCEIDVDECASAPCLNGGFCVDSINAYTCTCTSGTTGANCQVIDPCLPNPCWRGGTCFNNHETGFFCSCASGYIGDTCEIDINECGSGPCQNGGQCFDLIDEYLCVCRPGTSGNNCEQITSSITPNCPQDIHVYLPEGQTQAYVTWPEPQVISGGGHVVVYVIEGNNVTEAGTLFSYGNHKLAFVVHGNDGSQELACSFYINVTGPEATPSNTFYCANTDSIVYMCLMAVGIGAAIGFCVMYIRSKRRLASAGSRSMMPLDAVSKPKSINNISSFSDQSDQSRYLVNNQAASKSFNQQPPVPPPKPGELLEDRSLENAYEVMDNYGYMCFELKSQNREVYQLPRATYQKQKGINDF